MKNERDPTRKKALDYEKQIRTIGSSNRHVTRNIRRFMRTISNRADRRAAQQVLRHESARPDPDRLDAIQNQSFRSRRGYLGKGGKFTLRDYVASRTRYKACQAGRVYLRCRYDSEVHRESFADFLSHAIEGRVADMEALQEKFSELLSAIDRGFEHAFLAGFFADEPEWEQRIREWINRAI